MRVIRPQRGARWAFRCVEVRKWVEKVERAVTAVEGDIPFVLSIPLLGDVWPAYCVLKLRSQTVNSAWPCVTLALRATVHGVLASKSLSSVSISSGSRYAAST